MNDIKPSILVERPLFSTLLTRSATLSRSPIFPHFSLGNRDTAAAFPYGWFVLFGIDPLASVRCKHSGDVHVVAARDEDVYFAINAVGGAMNHEIHVDPNFNQADQLPLI